MHDEERQGYESVATEDIVQRVDEVVRETCRITIITGLYVEFSEVQDLICSLLLLNIQATENFKPVGFRNNLPTTIKLAERLQLCRFWSTIKMKERISLYQS